MSAALHLLVRTLHVLGMAVLLGGSAFAWHALGDEGTTSASLPAGFEWVFWGTMGVMVVTGVGNLGALGPPGPDTRWGALLTAKLLLVLAFVVGSFLRTLAVLRSPADSGAVRDRARGRLRRMYAGTAGTLVVVVVLAEVLAHG